MRTAAENAARSLARFGPEIIDDVIPLLSNVNAPERLAAINTLLSLGEPAAPRLIELLGHDDRTVAMSAAVALDRIKGTAIPELTVAVHRGNEQVTRYAAGALSSIGPVAGSALPTLLDVAGSDDRSDRSRLAAAYAALKIDPAESRRSKVILSTIPALVRVLECGDLEDRELGAEVAGDIGPPAQAALPALRTVANLRDHRDPESLRVAHVRELAKKAISAIETGKGKGSARE